jgi:hypothetical protein
VTRLKTALAALLLTATIAMPCAAQQASSTPLPDQICAGCFAYLEFSPSLEPESYAMRGQETETPKSLPAEGEPSDRLREQRVGLLATSKQ